MIWDLIRKLVAENKHLAANISPGNARRILVR